MPRGILTPIRRCSRNRLRCGVIFGNWPSSATLRLATSSRAAELVDAILEAEGENPNVLLKKASILGLQARTRRRAKYCCV